MMQNHHTGPVKNSIAGRRRSAWGSPNVHFAIVKPVNTMPRRATAKEAHARSFDTVIVPVFRLHFAPSKRRPTTGPFRPARQGRRLAALPAVRGARPGPA